MQKAFQGTPYTEMPKESRKHRACCVCGTMFIPNSGVNKFCSSICKTKKNQTEGSMSVESQYKRISGNWGRYFNRLLIHGRKNTLTQEILLKQLEKQKGLCALSGVPLTCMLEKGKRFSTNASIDRIKAGEDYSPENIQLVCTALNSFRKDTQLDEFIWFCEQVTNYQKRKEG